MASGSTNSGVKRAKAMIKILFSVIQLLFQALELFVSLQIYSPVLVSLAILSMAERDLVCGFLMRLLGFKWRGEHDGGGGGRAFVVTATLGPV